MKLAEIVVRNVRSFRKPTKIDFTDQYTGLPNDRLVIVGTNASGKTTLLEVTISLIKAFYHKQDSLYKELSSAGVTTKVVFLDQSANRLALELKDGKLSLEGNCELLPFYLFFSADRNFSESSQLEPIKINPWGYEYASGAENLTSYLDNGLPELATRFFSGRILAKTDNQYTLSASATDSTPIPLKKLPSGEKQALILLTLIAKHLKNGSLVMIDEFELSLHPTAQRKLYHLLSAYLQERDSQLIVATHSLEIVRASRETEVFSLDEVLGGIKT